MTGDCTPAREAAEVGACPDGAGPATVDRAASIRGQMTVLFAVMAVALFAFLALTIDGGLAFSHRRSMQNAADAGSLAGTRQLASYETGSLITNSDVYSAVVSAATANGWNPASDIITATYITTDRVPLGVVGQAPFSGLTAPPTSARGLEVSAVTTYPTFFAGIIGIDQLRSQADARSIFGYSCTADCLMPIGVFSQTFSSGVQYTFHSGNTGPGQFGWLFYSGGSATALCQDLAPGACTSGSRQRNEWIPGSSGVSWSSCVRNQLDQWVGKSGLIPIFGPGPGQSPGTVGCRDPETKCDTGTCVASCGQGQDFNYHIVGFASFRVTGYSRTNNSITGIFEHAITDAELTPGCNAQFGVMAINLIR